MSEPTVVATSLRRPRSAERVPVLPGFFPDPTVCAVGDDYYLATSSFEYFPGAPIFHSRDLVSWSQIGNILSDREQFRLVSPGASAGIYGGTLRHDGERFWFATTNVSDFGAGQLIVHSVDPAGPWSSPIRVPQAVGIDPDLCWAEDGTCLLTWHDFDFTVGAKGILQAPIDLLTGRLLAPPYPVWQGSGMPAAEGPHLHKVGRYWYLFLAEGGTERGHCVTVARSLSPEGPFEPCPWNPIFTRRSSMHEVQNVGHADLVCGPDGRWAMVYLGARPRGSTPGFHVLGRETFLAGVDWIDDWPVIDPSRYLVPEQNADYFDDFTSTSLHPRWVVPDGEAERFVRLSGKGGVQFISHSSTDLLCARVTDLFWHARALVEGAGEIRLRLDDRHWCAVTYRDGIARAAVRIGDITSEIGTTRIGRDVVSLSIRAVPPSARPLPHGHAGPDDLELSVDDGTGQLVLGRVDGRYFSTEVAGGFTGRMIALGSPTSDGLVREVRYETTNFDA